MSENPFDKKPEITSERTTDFTAHDLKSIAAYEEEGIPGITSLDDSTVIRMLDLYLGGKTYREISQIVSKPKVQVLFLSKRFDWFPKRMEYLRDLQETIVQRTLESKVVGQDFLIQLKQFFEKKIGNNIQNYLRTGDESWANAVDLKEVDKYIKTFETLDKLTSTKAKTSERPSAPAVGLNLGEGVTVTKINENQVEISPKEKVTKPLLTQLADFRRQEDAKKDSDIKGKQGEKK